VSGPEFRKFGGNTMCIEMRCGPHVLIFDAGSGMSPLGQLLKSEAQRDIVLFFTHFHYDHIMGFPFFGPLYDPAARVRVWSGTLTGQMTTVQVIEDFMRHPFFPVGPEICRAELVAQEFAAGDVLAPFSGVTIRTAMLNHPGGSIGYRVEFGGRAVAVITDTEHEPGQLDPAVLGLIAGCDLFLYDTTFTEEEFETYRGFGHSTWQQAIRLAQAAKARQVGFIHHAKWRGDAELTRLEAKARRRMPGAFFGRDGQIVQV
jgi:phosphoribosyl 1,2-cyclic phosphodiesterase